jgi:hypothetical protein
MPLHVKTNKTLRSPKFSHVTLVTPVDVIAIGLHILTNLEARGCFDYEKRGAPEASAEY